jgi:hypothetical protein
LDTFSNETTCAPPRLASYPVAALVAALVAELVAVLVAELVAEPRAP